MAQLRLIRSKRGELLIQETNETERYPADFGFVIYDLDGIDVLDAAAVGSWTLVPGIGPQSYDHLADDSTDQFWDAHGRLIAGARGVDDQTVSRYV